MSCFQKNSGKTITPSIGVGNIKLGEKAPSYYNKEDLEITISGKNQLVTEIIIKSDKYKTNEGFGVGSNLDEITSKLGTAVKNSINISKGNISIGSAGKGLLYKGIYFVDMNGDNFVDGVWLFSSANKKDN